MARPLKKSTTGSGLPRQFNVSVDEVDAKGLNLEGLGTHKVLRSGNDLEFIDPTVGTTTPDSLRSTARVSANDSTPGVLVDKIVPGNFINVVEQNDSGNETLEVSYDPSVLNYADTLLNDAGLVKNTQNFEVYMTLNTTIPATGLYKVLYTYQWSLNDASNDFIGQCRANGTVLYEHIQEPKDAGGTGVNLPNTDGGNTNTGTSQRYAYTVHDVLNLNAGANSFDIQFRCSANNDQAAIYKGRISVEKFGAS